MRKQKQHEQADLEQFISNFHFGTKRKDIINLPSGEIGVKGEATIAKNIYRQNRSWHNNNQPPQAHPLLPAAHPPKTHPPTHFKFVPSGAKEVEMKSAENSMSSKEWHEFSIRLLLHCN